MNKDIALKILEVNADNNLSYDEKTDKLVSIADMSIESHTNIRTLGSYGKRNCYILEAYKFLMKEFESNNLVYLDLINQLCDTDFKVI